MEEITWPTIGILALLVVGFVTLIAVTAYLVGKEIDDVHKGY